MDNPVANPVIFPTVLQKSFPIRLAEAKKAAIEAALKSRQECLKAADLKQHPFSSSESLGNRDVNTDTQPPVNDEIVKSTKITSVQPKFGNPYSELKSARKRKRPADNEKTKSLISQSACKTSAKRPTHTVKEQLVKTRTTRHISAWYNAIDMKAKFSRADLEYIEIENLFSELRNRLHNMQFYDFLSGVLIRKSRLLEDEGLPAVFDASPGLFPWDIRADSRMIYQKWAIGQLDPHLFRGIQDSKITKSDGKVVKSRRFESGQRVSPNYVGEGNLVNGMWWPLQFCAMRDGAHGEIEAGIHGQVGRGAYSIVVSNGGYKNVDEGVVIKYCGTSGALGVLSHGTKLLMESFTSRNPIRVLRSASLPQSNIYRPTKGLRYDGLYEITGFEILDAETAMHRFVLKRRGGQDPIRYQGVEARPTEDELVEYTKIRKLLGFGL